MPGSKLFLSSPAVVSSSQVTNTGSIPPIILRFIDPSLAPKQEISVETGSVSNIGASIISIFVISSQS